MNDIKISDEGDILVDAASGDIALTGGSNFEFDANEANALSQLALIALKTEKGDFITHQELGSLLNQLIGFPNKPSTAKAGEKFIVQALRSHGISGRIQVDSWPEGLNTIAYEVKIQIGSSPKMLTFTMMQTLEYSPYDVEV